MGNDWMDRSTIRAAFTCGNCGGVSVFEMRGDNIITFNPGRMVNGPDELGSATPERAREAYSEAMLCYYGAAYRGTVAMCRSAVEEALDDKGAKGRDLHTKVEDAKSRLNILGDEEVALAQGARLVGRNALHRGASVTQTQATVALGATFDLVNHIASQTPSP